VIVKTGPPQYDAANHSRQLDQEKTAMIGTDAKGSTRRGRIP